MDFLHRRFGLLAAMAVVVSVLMAAAVAKVTQPTKPAVQAILPGGVTVVPNVVRVIEITKQDRLVMPAPPPAPPVKVASVEPEAPTGAEPEPQVHRVRRPRLAESGDICARHHLRKVTHGHGWRCR